MSSPQTDLGFIQIATGSPANDVLSALGSAQLSGVEYQIVIYILRKTWGYGKKESWISLQQFVDFTGRTDAGIHKGVRGLRERNIVHTSEVKGKPTIYSFNKDFRSWKGVYYSSGVDKSTGVNKSQRGIRKLGGGVHESSGVGVYGSSPTKEKNTKEKVKEKPTGIIVPIFSLSHLMPDFVVSPDGDLPAETKPKKKQPFNRSDYQELTRVMKKVCGFTTLQNGTKPQDNYARHILMFLLKVLKEKGYPEQDAIDNLRANMEEFCELVRLARENDRFLHSKMTSLQEIYFELKRGRVFEAAKSRNPKASTHLSL